MSLETITTISPTTNEGIITRSGISLSDLALLPETSVKAFQSWRTTKLSDRKRIVVKALEILASRTDELAAELTDQMGRPIAYTGKEISTAIKRSEFFLRTCDDVLQDTPGEAEAGFKRFIRKVPVGPVLVIFAWNYPYLILVNTLIPALLAGNTVILKPSPQTPTVVEQVAKAFEEAGLPAGVLQYFHSGSPTTIESIVRNPLIADVCFTGSVAGGLAVQRAAADRIVNVGLELGGKDPAYVRGDVDVAWAADQIVDGCVFNSGQSCCSLERVYVHDSVHDEFVAAVKDVLKGYRLGDPTDVKTHVGPVVSKRAKTTIEEHIQDALNKGAKNETPENATFANPPAGGNYVVPTLLTGVTHEMTVMTEETFGPVIPVMKVKDDAEAVALMNDSEFGLTASVWTKDKSTAAALIDEIEAGTVFVNRCDYPSPDLAWTGWKNSGRGYTLSRFGFDQFVKLKSYHIADGPA
ncbi:aldehyde dehydrogenase [Ophiostoma piceae UAMH 11346]|uniref:aldehyde dehydrogenase (NAD(+)) n=1 Tax=Ophiostoma piceae (strain UAMH 11346) TaxID=1262450 RepID=S3DB02_OPHP1|nr:aldehyde dehydrogenase [Ophiostoma piceae UAMH 11346]